MKNVTYVSAGAGSGKTYFLTEKLSSILESGEVKGENVMMTTFTELAAGELKTKAKARRIEKKTVLVIRDGEKVLLRKRPPKGLLAGLYEFPNLEGHLTQEEAVRFAEYQNLMPLQVQCLPEAKHIFSHIEWQMTGYMIRVADVDSFAASKSASREGGYLLVPLEQTRREYAVPAAFDAYAKCIRLREES